MLYRERELCPTAVTQMRELGFHYLGHSARGASGLQHPEGCPPEDDANNRKCEVQAYFVNKHGRWPAPSMAELPLVT